jgi:hypothetical protein
MRAHDMRIWPSIAKRLYAAGLFFQRELIAASDPELVSPRLRI